MCTLCKDTIWRTPRDVRRHEDTIAHRKTAAFLETRAAARGAEAAQLLERARAVAEPLAEVCRDVSSALLASQPLPPDPPIAHSERPNSAPIIGAELTPAFNHIAVARMADTMAAFLEDPGHAPPEVDPLRGAPDTDDFPLPGMSILPQTNARLIVNLFNPPGLFTGARPIRKRQDAEKNPAWYPWPNKVVSAISCPYSLYSLLLPVL